MITMAVLGRIGSVDLEATRCVFISAIRFATLVTGPCPPFRDELRTAAQEQIEYMLEGDEDMPLLAADNEVKLETVICLSKTFCLFEEELFSILKSESPDMQSLSRLEWMCNIMSRMDLMTDFVLKWINLSGNILHIIEGERFEGIMWDSKVRILEVTSKVLDAVGYGNVIVSAPERVQLIKLWLPFIRKLKSCLDSIIKTDREFPYKMDEDMCQSIEGAIVSLVLGLPSDDQADILADWMKTEQLKYPDLTEAFEIWCFRTKSAKRRLVGGLDIANNKHIRLGHSKEKGDFNS